MKLDEGEKLIAVRACNPENDVMLSTRNGKCIRFNVDEIRVFVGRDSNGVRGIKLIDEDAVISMTILDRSIMTMEERDAYLRQAAKLRSFDEISGSDESQEKEVVTIALSPERFEELAAAEQFILTATENGFGKRSSAYEYRTAGRGGLGIDSIIVNSRNGGVVASFPIQDNDQVMLVTDKGKLIRCPVYDIRIAGRRTQGVTLFRIAEDEKVVAISHICGEQLGEETIDQEESPEEV
jgi:DNA gyrase subunit A